MAFTSAPMILAEQNIFFLKNEQKAKDFKYHTQNSCENDDGIFIHWDIDS